MAKRSKAYQAAAEKIAADVNYEPAQAIALAKETNVAKYDATVEVALRLGVDPRKADQMVRGTVNLPHGTGKTARVLVFAAGDRAEAAREAGADYVGSDDLLEKVAGGFTDFDAAVATPDMMGKVGRLGKVLGPKGLMPNPKSGTVTMDVKKAIGDVKAGKVEYRLDKTNNVHVILGKVSFGKEKLLENYKTLIDALQKAKPAAAKGQYFKNISVCSSMGPGIKVVATM